MFKVKEASEINVRDKDDEIVKYGFTDIHDAYEWVINQLGKDGHRVLYISELITIQRVK